MKKLFGFSIIVFQLICFFSASALAQVPKFFHYQSLLHDDGGNLVGDGTKNIFFRIVDESGNIFYEEHQRLEITDGRAAALIGNGLDPETQAPTGGIPTGLLYPDANRYLEVQVEDFSPEGPLEIVSVPYAFFADKALGVVESGVTGNMIAEKSIESKHLSEEIMRSGAGTIGVAPGLTSSTKTNVQEVLQDLDTAIVNVTQTQQQLFTPGGSGTAAVNASIDASVASLVTGPL